MEKKTEELNNNFVELTEEEAQQISGGRRRHPLIERYDPELREMMRDRVKIIEAKWKEERKRKRMAEEEEERKRRFEERAKQGIGGSW